MAAVITGVGLGLERSSQQLLGGQGQLGQAAIGQAQNDVYVNAANGNLVVQATDQILTGIGLDDVIAITYNSLSAMAGPNGSGWSDAAARHITGLTGTVNTTGSTVERVAADGGITTYLYNATTSAYVGNEGGGAYDALSYNTTTANWTWTDGATQTKDVYSSAGALLTSVDAYGNQLTYGYNTSGATSGLLAYVETADGEETTFNYNAADLISSVTTTLSGGSSFTDVTYGYNTSNQLTSETTLLTSGGASYVTSYGYSGGQLSSISESDGSDETIVYAGGKVSSLTEYLTSAASTGLTLSYGTSATTATDGHGAVTTFGYTTSGLTGELTSIGSPLGATASFTYDSMGDVLTATSPGGGGYNTETYTYDGSGNQLTSVDSLGDTTSATYNAQNQVLTSAVYTVASSGGTGASGPDTTDYIYNAAGTTLEFEVSPDDEVTQYFYNGSTGEVTSTIAYADGLSPPSSPTLTNLNTWVTGLSSSAFASAVWTNTAYDVRGNVTSATTYSSGPTSLSGTGGTVAAVVDYSYNNAGLLLSEQTSGFSAGMTETYDNLGRVLSSTDVNGATTTYAYTNTSSGLSVLETEADGTTITSTYNLAGELLSTVEAGSNFTSMTTSYSYNSLGELADETDPNGVISYFVYDADGRKTADVDALGDATAYTYNANNQIIETDAYATPLASLSSLTSATNYGTPATITLPTASPGADQVSYSFYDQAGRLTETLDGAGAITTYSYNGASQLVSETAYFTTLTAATMSGYATSPPTSAPTPTASSGNDRTTTYAYDADGRRTTTIVDPSGLDLVTTTTYDAFGNVVAVTAPNGGITRNVYDSANRLIYSVDPDGYVSEVLAYDAEGHALATYGYATPLTATQLSALALATSASAIAADVTTSTADTLARDVYDADGRLAYAIDPTGAVTQHTYDGLGEVVAVTQYATLLTSTQFTALGSTPTASAVAADITTSGSDRTTRYAYDGAGRRVYTVDADGNVSKTTYDADSHVVASTAYALPLSSTTLSSLTLTTMASDSQSFLYSAVSGGVSATSGKDETSLDVYNSDNELAYTINAGGYVVADSYNALGEVAESYDYAVPIASSALSSLGLNPTTTAVAADVSSGANDSEFRYAYDADGRQVYAIDALGDITQTSYDALGQVAAQTAYATALTTSQFTSLGGAPTATAVAAYVTSTSLDRTARTAYDTAGHVAYTIDPNGDVSHVLAYNGLGEALAVYDYATPVTSLSGTVLTTSAVASAVSVNSATDRTTRDVYDADGKLIYEINALNQVTYDTYGAYGLAASSTGYATALTTSQSTALGNTPTVSAVAADVTTSTHDETTRFIYDHDGRLAFSVDPAGEVTETSYDAFGDVVTTHAFAALYTSAGVPSFATMSSWATSSANSATDEVTSYAYNGDGQVLSQTVALTSSTNAVTTSQYDTFGNLVKLTDPNGNVGYFYYNTLNQQTLAIDAAGYATATTYDLAGHTTSVTRYATVTSGAGVGSPPTVTGSSTDDITRMTYDLDGRLAFTIDGNGYVTQNSYDAVGNLASTRVYATAFTSTGVQTLSAMKTWAAANVTSSDDVTRFAYDDGGRKTYQIDGVGDVTGYAYDAFGNLASEHQYATALTSGQLTTLAADAPLTTAEVAAVVTSATGDKTTSYTYDALSEVTSQASVVYLTTSSGSVVTTTATETKAYDSFGNVIETVDADLNETFYVYDQDNRKIEEGQQVSSVSGGAIGDVSSWGYNAFSDETTAVVYGAMVTLPTSAGGALTTPSSSSGFRETVTGYDLDNRAITTTISATSAGAIIDGAYVSSAYTVTSGNIVTSSVYDADGNVIETVDGNGYDTFYYYDHLGRKVGEATPSFTASGTLEYYVTTYALDQEGNVLTETQYATPVTSVTTTLPSVSSSTIDRITNFTYDRDGHRLTESRLNVIYFTESGITLTQSSGTSTMSYTYNFLGEVLTQKQATGDTTSYTYDAAGRQIEVVDASYTDAGGGTDTPTSAYAYNGLDNLTSVSVGNNGSAQRITSYAYGAGGVLTSSTDATGFTQSYSYDANGNVVGDSYARQTAISGSAFTEEVFTTYDAMGRVIATRTADYISGGWVGDTDNTGYDAYGEVASKGVNAASGASGTGSAGDDQIVYVYDGAGRVIGTNAGNGAMVDYVYDADGNQTLEIAPADNDGYSSAVNLSGLSLTSAISLVTSGGVIGWQDAAGAAATISEYNPSGEVISTIQPDRQLSVVSGTVSTTSITTSSGYDAFGDLVASTDALGALTSSIYNTLGNEAYSAVEDSAANWTDNTGTAHSGVTAVTSNYDDLAGRVIGNTDANGNRTTYTLLAGTGYGGAQALQTAVFYPDGGEIQYGYDVFGDQTTITTKVTNTYSEVDTLTYDGDGRLLTETYPADTNDSDAALVDYYAYDGLGQRIAETNSVLDTSLLISGTTSHIAVAGYSSLELIDATGRTTSAPDMETTTYDAQGRVTSTVDYMGNQTTYAYAWNSGLITSGMTTSATAFGGWVETITEPGAPTSEIVDRDYYGRTVSQSDFGSSTDTYSYVYDEAGAITSQTNFLSQHIETLYLNTGETYEVLDNGATVRSLAGGSTSATAVTTYGYDKAGDITSESYVVPGPAGTHNSYENETAVYDGLGRVTSVTDTGANNGTIPLSIAYQYDLDGNVMNMSASYTTVSANGMSSGGSVENYWYSYDAMNRVIVDEGIVSGGAITIGYQDAGMDITYDYAGDRTTISSLMSKVFHDRTDHTTFTSDYVNVEYYTYTSNGLLHTVTDSGGWTSSTSTSGSYTYDALGRATYEVTSQYTGSSIGGTTTSSTYDADSHLLVQVQSTTDASVNPEVLTTDYYYNLAISSGGPYTGAYMDGQVVAVITSGYYYNPSYHALPNTSTVNTYTWRTGALETLITYKPNTTSTYTTTQTYDDNGYLISAAIVDGASHNVSYVNNADGELIARSDSAPAYLEYYYIGDQQIGDTANALLPGTQVDFAQAVGQQYVAAKPGQSADFDQDYSPVNLTNPGSTGITYTVQTGDTLYSIAQTEWGDSSLWYLIADANGLSANATLTAGTVLAIPGGDVVSIGHSTTASKPYSASDAVGDIQPTAAPPPPHQSNGCGVVGAIIEAVIAIAVAVIAPESIPLFEAEGALGSGALGTLGALVVDAGVGDVVAQGVGLATGIQSKFSWQELATSILTAAVLPGVQNFGPIAQLDTSIGDGFAADFIDHAVTSTIVQGVEVATGLQSKFNWAGVLEAGLTAGATGVVANAFADSGAFPTYAAAADNPNNPVIDNNPLEGQLIANSPANFTPEFLASAAGAIVGATANTVLTGMSFGRSLQQVLPDVIGQTIGNAIAGNVEQSQEQQAQQDAAVPAWRDPNLIHLASDAVYDNGQPVGTLGGNSQSNVSDAAAFADIGQIEVSGSAAIADRLTPPNPNGGGWTVGWEQEDFSTNPSTAQTTLVSALGASGYLDSTNAQLAAAAFTAAGTSSNVNFSGIVDAQGDPVDLGTINDALATTAGAASVYNSSYNNYTGKFDALMTNITQDDNVLTSVHSALSDQTYGPMLKLVIADYNNQIGMNPNSATGMMGLLTTGSATSNGGTVTTLDESSPQSIVSSVMQYYLNSQYASNYGADVTRRLTDDVQATITAENNAGVTPPSLPITVTSTNGTAKISLSPNGTSYRGTWKPSN